MGGVTVIFRSYDCHTLNSGLPSTKKMAAGRLKPNHKGRNNEGIPFPDSFEPFVQTWPYGSDTAYFICEYFFQPVAFSSSN